MSSRSAQLLSLQVGEEPSDRGGKHITVIFAGALVLGGILQGVTLPIFSDEIGNSGGSPYFVVWFSSFSFVILYGILVLLQGRTGGDGNHETAFDFSMKAQMGPLLIGLCDALNGMMVVFASPSSRTPPYLQSILCNFSIPLTIIMRGVLLRDFPNKSQLLSSIIVMLSLFLSLAPKILSRGDSNEDAAGYFWPIWFMLGSIPGVFMNVMEEKVLGTTHVRTNMVWFVFCLNFWQLIFVTTFFWLDVVPGYGMSTDLQDWYTHMFNGFACFFSGGAALFWGLSFILGYMLTYIAAGLLLRHTEGALWQSVIGSLVTPICTLWWALFNPKPSFHWQPNWSADMTFAACGLAVMLPAVVVYKLKGKSSKPAGSWAASASFSCVRAAPSPTSETSVP